MKSALLSPVWQPRKDVWEPNSLLHNHINLHGNVFSPFSACNHGFICWKLPWKFKVLVNHQAIPHIREQPHSSVVPQVQRGCAFWDKTSPDNPACSLSFPPGSLLQNLNAFSHSLSEAPVPDTLPYWQAIGKAVRNKICSQLPFLVFSRNSVLDSNWFCRHTQHTDLQFGSMEHRISILLKDSSPEAVAKWSLGLTCPLTSHLSAVGLVQPGWHSETIGPYKRDPHHLISTSSHKFPFR